MSKKMTEEPLTEEQCKAIGSQLRYKAKDILICFEMRGLKRKLVARLDVGKNKKNPKQYRWGLVKLAPSHL